MFNFGDEVRNKITGVQGIVYARSEYHTGCVHIGFLRRDLDKDGKARDLEWDDVSGLELVTVGAVNLVSEKKTGGPSPNPPKY